MSKIWNSLMVRFEIIGYSRAASYMAMHGMYDEAKQLMMEVGKLKAN